MRYFTRLQGSSEVEVELRDSRGSLVAILDGREFRIDCAAVDPGEKYSILIDGRSFDVTVDGDGRELSLIVDGHAFQAGVEDERERAMSQIAGVSPAAGGIVESAMPGIVRRVEVKEGDAVNQGDRLLILEAMKMENEIRAEFGGIVAKVHVSEGQTVDGGRPLVSIVPAS
jgi:biotin carboxyl carrier protein